MAAAGIQHGTGRRKTSTARFPPPRNRGHRHQPQADRAGVPHRGAAHADQVPPSVTETADKFDILATIAGGGVAGQAGALRLGIARALVEFNIELRQRLKKAGF